MNLSSFERQNKDMKNASSATHKSHRSRKHQSLVGSDVEYDNGNISPLYSNWDQEMQDHLLPLQNYILEQAKLSGYRPGDTMDSDSLHSDSESEHSFSGHEPDNEDSDHSEGRGDYLTHHYGGIGDYGTHGGGGGGGGGGGVSYYNFEVGFDKNDKEDM